MAGKSPLPSVFTTLIQTMAHGHLLPRLAKKGWFLRFLRQWENKDFILAEVTGLGIRINTLWRQAERLLPTESRFQRKHAFGDLQT